MSAAPKFDYLSVREPTVLSFTRSRQKPLLDPSTTTDDREQELRAVQERVRQLREQYRLAPQAHAQELLKYQVHALELLRLQKYQSALSVTGPEPANRYGFPRPSSEQSPSPATALGEHYFVNDTQWRAVLDHGQFDDIVCGSGMCALAYIDKVLELDPKRMILVLERGGFWLPTHFQNLPLPLNMLLSGSAETFPWTLTWKTFYGDTKFMRGSSPFFGGRSVFWSAWSPRPSLSLMRNFPESLLKTAGKEQFWEDCRKLLHVVKASELGNDEYRNIQKSIDSNLKKAVEGKKITGAEYAEPANLAVGRTTARSKLVFEKFSTPGPLLTLHERQAQLAKEGKGSPLTIATDVVVERFDIDPDDPKKHANVLETSRGTLCFPGKTKPNIILATGAIPSCTIVMNSVKAQHDRAGSRLTGHFLTHMNARFPMTVKGPQGEALRELELAASYVAGRDQTSQLQYHADITSVFSPNPERDAIDASILCPDYFSVPTKAQLQGSENHIVVACVMLGEINERSDSWVKLNPENPDVTTNVKVQIGLSGWEKVLQETMYKATLEIIKAMAGDDKAQIQYWHDHGDGTGTWSSEPDKSQFLMTGMCHEASTLYMSDTIYTDGLDDPDFVAPQGNKDEELIPVSRLRVARPSVDSDYKVYGTGNVYATGSAIFPTAGSWNPTLTMCGFAQDLAQKLKKA